MQETQPMYRTPARIARIATEAAHTLNAGGVTGPRPFRMADIIREAIETGLPEVLRRHGLDHLINAPAPADKEGAA